MGLKAWDVPPPCYIDRYIYIFVKVGVKDTSLCGVPDASGPISQPPGGEG